MHMHITSHISREHITSHAYMSHHTYHTCTYVRTTPHMYVHITHITRVHTIHNTRAIVTRVDVPTRLCSPAVAVDPVAAQDVDEDDVVDDVDDDEDDASKADVPKPAAVPAPRRATKVAANM